MSVEIPLTRGYVTLIDEADYERVTAAGSWCARPTRSGVVYAQRKLQRPGRGPTTIALHAFLTGWPLVDHVNGDGLDNRRANLRAATFAENARNARRRRDNTSGYKGVSFFHGIGLYVARIRVDGRVHWLGRFSDPADAARVYDAAAIELHGEFARLNFPEGTAA